MISSAAVSVSGSHALGLGAQAAPADDAAVSTDFAALLGTTVTSGAVPDAAAGQDGVTDQATLLKQVIGKQMRQASDGASGKKLPQGLPDTPDGLTDAAKPADGAAEATAAPDGTASALLPIATEIVQHKAEHLSKILRCLGHKAATLRFSKLQELLRKPRQLA